MNQIVELGKTYAAARREKERLKKLLTEAQEKEDDAENELMQALIDAGTKSITIEGIGRLTLSRSTYPSVNAANKPTFFTYLKQAGHGGLIKEDVNSRTLDSFLKRHVDELRKQLIDEGLTEGQAIALNRKDPEKYDSIMPNFRPDEMDAEEMAQDILISHGAAMFTKQGISLTKE